MSTENKALHAPWRMDYIRSLEKPDGDKCFICLANNASTIEEKKQRLVLWSTEQSITILNRYPYTNGHLMVCPKSHKAEMDQLTDAELLDMQQQTVIAVKLLKKCVSAQGFNIGINIGRIAGAGLPGHVHQHVVPRWGGDTNFISVVGEVRVVPQAMSQLYDELVAGYAGIK